MTAIAAAIILLAGCGGGSHKASSTVTVGGPPQAVSGTDGTFRTAVPLGFTYIPAKAQFYAVGYEEHGLTTDLVVVREPIQSGDIDAVARRQVSLLRHGERLLSPPSRLTVGGQPALRLDYRQIAEGAKWHARQVFVRWRGFVYHILDFSPVTQDPTASRALEELIHGWQWQ